MDTTILVDELDKSAFKLVNNLKDAGFLFTVAALMKNQEEEDWHLVLGIPGLLKNGSRDPLTVVYNVIKENELNLSLNDIKLLDDKNATFDLLRERFESDPKIFRKVFRENYLNGVRFPDSIIYRVI